MVFRQVIVINEQRKHRAWSFFLVKKQGMNGKPGFVNLSLMLIYYSVGHIHMSGWVIGYANIKVLLNRPQRYYCSYIVCLGVKKKGKKCYI